MEEKNELTKHDLDDVLTVRINSKTKEDFKTKAGTLNRGYQVLLREIVDAFNNDRVRIIPTDEQKKGLEIYQG